MTPEGFVEGERSLIADRGPMRFTHFASDRRALDAVREAGLECRIAVCVLDREEGGADALARRGARLVPLFRAGELLSAEKTAAKPHG